MISQFLGIKFLIEAAVYDMMELRGPHLEHVAYFYWYISK
jgi:hypothetical protein